MGFGRKKILKAAFEFNLRTVVFFFGSPNFVNKTSSINNSEIYKVVTLTIVNIGGITRGIL